MLVDGDGEVTDFLRLPHVMKRRNGWNREEAELKVNHVTFVVLSRNKQCINRAPYNIGFTGFFIFNMHS